MATKMKTRQIRAQDQSPEELENLFKILDFVRDLAERIEEARQRAGMERQRMFVRGGEFGSR